MKAVIIGAGNVATHLSKALQHAGIEIVQVYSRTKESAQVLSEQLGVECTTEYDNLRADADIYIYSVKDSALNQLISSIKNKNAIHLHTAGSIPMSIFENRAKDYGVLYPLQTFSKAKEVNFSQIPVFIEGNSDETEVIISQIAQKLSEKVYNINSEQRLRLHISAVFACNFTNCMYNIAAELVEDAALPFEILKPLIVETANKIETLHPFDAQTGPAVRYDNNVIDKHLKLLNSNEKLQRIYTELSQLIYETHKNKL